MATGFRFDRFMLDLDNRQLSRDGAPIELNARYLDALALLLSEAGSLVSKDRFLDQVWRGVPVTDEALTQCIKTLRARLGDSATSPSFIETVPKHGYRFIAPVSAENVGKADRALVRGRFYDLPLTVGAGTLGGGIAGIVGGMIYGFAGATQPLQPGLGAASVMLVLICLTLLVALVGAAGVSLGIALAGAGERTSRWTILGGALGGLVVGGIVKLLGLDAFTLIVGQSPGDFTGATEGMVLGGAIALGYWIGNRGPKRPSLRRAVFASGVTGGIAGLLIPLLGGRLMGGSLDLLASRLPGSRLRLDPIGHLFGEPIFGPTAQMVTGALEGALFAACVVGAMSLMRKAR